MQNAWRLVLGGALLLAILGTVYFVMDYQKKRVDQAYVKEYEEALHLHHEADLDKSISAFQNLAETAPTISKATQAKLKLAFDLFSRNQGDDRARAVQIYKDIITDSSVSPFQRAIAINDLLDLYQGTHDELFARDYIFKGEPFETLVTNSNLAFAVRKAYEMGDSLYPLSLTEFRIANWYSLALQIAPNLSDTQRSAYLEQLKYWTNKGEMNLPQTLSLGYEASKLGYIYQLLGMNLADIAELTDKNYTKAEEAFKKALTVLAPEDELHTYGIGLFLRFHYAAILARTDPVGRRDEIRSLLQNIVQRPSAYAGKYLMFDDFIKHEAASSHDGHTHNKDLRRLAAISPEFKSYLSSQWGITL